MKKLTSKFYEIVRQRPRNDMSFAVAVAGITNVRAEDIQVAGKGCVDLNAQSRILFEIKTYLRSSALSVQLVLDISFPLAQQRGAPRVTLDYGEGYHSEYSYEMRRINENNLWGVHIPFPQFVREIRCDIGSVMMGPATINAFYVQRSDLRGTMDWFLGLDSADQQRIASGKINSVLQSLRRHRRDIDLDISDRSPQMALGKAISHGLLTHEARSAPTTRTYLAFIDRFERLQARDREHMRIEASNFALKPKFSIIMPVYNPPIDLLEDAIRSLQDQTYDEWELCIADDASPDFSVRSAILRMAENDPRIRYVFREKNGHISEASNSAAALASGEFLVLIDNDDLLPAHALWTVAFYINRHPTCRMLFSDEDKLNLEGMRAQPYFKGGFDRFLMYGHNMFSHLGIYERRLFEEVGGFRKGYEGSQDYDLTLRCLECCEESQIVHIPHVLYHWRQVLGSTSMGAGEKHYAFEAAKKAINDHFRRMNYPLESIDSNVSGVASIRTLPVRNPQTISVVLLTRNGLGVLKPCIESLRMIGDPLLEIIIVDNYSDDTETIDYLADLQSVDRSITVLRSETEFNFAYLCNLGVRHCRGEIICLLNNDTEVISTDLFQRARAWLSISDVGIVGSRLLYPDNKIQHFGVYTGLGPRGIAVHAHHFRHDHDREEFSKSALLQQFGAVTGACCFLRRRDYGAVGGMDELFPVAYNDVDLCLSIRKLGLKVICDPGIKLYHHESISRGADTDPTRATRLRKDADRLIAKWGQDGLRDPFYSPNFSTADGNFEIGEFPTVDVPWKHPGTSTSPRSSS